MFAVASISILLDCRYYYYFNNNLNCLPIAINIIDKEEALAS